MGLYTGFDLHSTNTYVEIIDEEGRRLWKKKLRNDPNLISETLRPFKKDIDSPGRVEVFTDQYTNLQTRLDNHELHVSL